ncbi:hypothetical protein [Sulfuricurvum sp.]|uniref:hypothetical protein n=1 Tax=Sulfuricurvum sp. TaxID=2025608 RepID=UPI002D66C552|nr:hypothetical protein [Sulfuricurvum sp.]HZF70482.1 hypothetical protein [Sulfuricurvum sp.]
MFYLALFLALLYFKIARVHKKEERPRVSSALIQHLFVGIAIVSLLLYGFAYENLYLFMPLLFVFATVASLMVTAVQLGIFVDGKPLFGLTHIYRYLPALRVLIVVLISIVWVVHSQTV